MSGLWVSLASWTISSIRLKVTVEDLWGEHKQKKTKGSADSSAVTLYFLCQPAQLSWEPMPFPLLMSLREWILYNSEFNSPRWCWLLSYQVVFQKFTQTLPVKRLQSKHTHVPLQMSSAASGTASSVPRELGQCLQLCSRARDRKGQLEKHKPLLLKVCLDLNKQLHQSLLLSTLQWHGLGWHSREHQGCSSPFILTFIARIMF